MQRPEDQQHNIRKPGCQNVPKTNILFNIYLIFDIVVSRLIYTIAIIKPEWVNIFEKECPQLFSEESNVKR
jgi:hypothetical protein